MEIKYNIQRITETRYSYDLPFGSDVPEKRDISFGFSHSISADKTASAIIIELVVTINDDKSGNKLAENGIQAIFGVDPFDTVVLDADKDGIKVSEPRLMDTFISIVIGALRGFLVKNFKQTPLEGCILPLIPMELIHKIFTTKE
ncbi:MAG: hypothetical protein IJK93_05135 [Muribaculaceae bacterium]|nr:hypothetical protein [Muribaculaceae bacterium]